MWDNRSIQASTNGNPTSQEVGMLCSNADLVHGLRRVIKWQEGHVPVPLPGVSIV
jgi:hypothetical protein